MPDSHVYYFDVGRGRWAGDFTFRVTDWSRLRRASIGATNLFLVVGMHTILRVFGKAQLESEVTGAPDEGPAGVANNIVKINNTVYPCSCSTNATTSTATEPASRSCPESGSDRFRSSSTCGRCARHASRPAGAAPCTRSPSSETTGSPT